MSLAAALPQSGPGGQGGRQRRKRLWGGARVWSKGENVGARDRVVTQDVAPQQGGGKATSEGRW